jgi:hypothetical protein
MKRAWPLSTAVLALLAVALFIRSSDRNVASEALYRAYAVRIAGARGFSLMSGAFQTAGIDGVSIISTNDPDFLIWAAMSKRAAATMPKPLFFGKDRLLALTVAARQLDELIRNPRGTWLTLTQEVADKRSRLEAAVITVETEDVPEAVVTARRVEAEKIEKELVATILDGKLKVAEEARLEAARALPTPSISEEERRAATARTMAEYLELSRRERSAYNATAAPGGGVSRETVGIEFSRSPAPTPALVKR